MTVGWIIIMLLLPFHAFISTWGGTTIGPLWIWKAWKEVLLAVLVVLGFVQCFVDRELLHILWRSWVTRLIVIYGVLHVVVALVVGNQMNALVFGLAINLRIVSFLLVSEIVGYYLKPSRRELLYILLIPAGGVVLFGLLQMFVLPYDLLSWFGYKANVTIAPYNTIDQQLNQLRAMSTLRGPNPLGAYLILPGIVLFWMIWEYLRKYRKKHLTPDLVRLGLVVSSFVALLAVLYYSHSRSAWLGFIAALGLYIFMSVSRSLKLALLSIGLAGMVLVGGGIYEYRNTPFVQNVILHDNPKIGPEETSNQGHIDSLKQAVSDIAERPLMGCAPGCAGPASFYDEDGARLAENYYLQVGQEVGLLGLLLFAGISVLVGLELYRRRLESMALIMFVTLIGISVANLLLHVWADDTLAYIWWGIAGVILATIPASSSRT